MIEDLFLWTATIWMGMQIVAAVVVVAVMLRVAFVVWRASREDQ